MNIFYASATRKLYTGSILNNDKSVFTLLNKNVQNDTVEISNLSQKIHTILRDIKSLKTEDSSQSNINTDLTRVLLPGEEQTNEIIVSLKESAQKLSKPDNKMDDIQWGAMVELGNVIGINDEDILSNLTTDDLKMYYSEFVDKKDVTDPAINQFNDSELFWKNVFKVDENGSFIKENGIPQRNPDFEYTS